MEAVGGRPVGDTGEFNRVHGNMVRAEVESEVFNGRLLKVTFFRLQEQVVVTEVFKDEVDRVVMLLQSGSGNQDVVHVNEDFSSVDEVFEYLVHHGLEGGQGIRKAKEHDPRFKHALIGFESGLPFIAFFDVDV